mgnify:CR=1 FL=1
MADVAAAIFNTTSVNRNPMRTIKTPMTSLKKDATKGKEGGCGSQYICPLELPLRKPIRLPRWPRSYPLRPLHLAGEASVPPRGDEAIEGDSL